MNSLITSTLPRRVGTLCRSGDGLLMCERLMGRIIVSRRYLNATSVRQSKSKDVTETVEGNDSRDKSEPTAQDTTQKMVRTQYIDKKSLVWDKRYKSVEEVPEMLPYQTIVQARNRFRIRANLVMIGLTVLAALAMVYTGKERAKAGDTVEKRTLERHRQLRAQKAEEDRAAQAAGAAEGSK